MADIGRDAMRVQIRCRIQDQTQKVNERMDTATESLGESPGPPCSGRPGRGRSTVWYPFGILVQ